ncbi:Uncharacterised protein [Bordetella pertussis]|nr:Uncharacterised protein [Bordetella pertussis]
MAGTAVTGDGMAGMAFERLRGALPLGVGY